MNLIPMTDTKQSAGYTAAGTSTITGSTITHDAGVDSVVHVAHFGTVSSGQTGTVYVEHSADGSSWSTVTGTTYTLTDNDSNKFFRQEISRPSKKYSRLVIARGGANLVLNSAFAILNGIRKQPANAGTTELNTATPVVNA